MKMNKKMERLMNELDSVNSNQHFEFNLKDLNKLFLPNFQCVYDCIIISNKKICLSEQEFERVIKNNTDKTGYESSNNDTRINDYVQNENLSIYQALSLALIVKSVWANTLKMLDGNAKYCFIISCSDNYVTLRFHKMRNDEGMWLSSNLEGYNEPVGYIII